MKKDTIIKILLADRYPRKEAESLLAARLAEVYEGPDALTDAAREFDTTPEDIKAGHVNGLKLVNYNGADYIIIIAS